MWKRRPPNDLTPRECEILKFVRLGLTNEEIAQRLDITLAGVKYHVSAILSKLGVASREEAAAWEPPERRPWYWKLVWLGGASIVVAAAAGLAALLSDSGTNLILESDNVAGDSVTGATTPTPIDRSPTSSTPGTTPPFTPTPTPPPRSTPAPIGPVVTDRSELLPAAVDTSEPAPASTQSAPAPVDRLATKIAFVTGSGDGSGYIDVIAHGGGWSRITSGTTPAWSPDGTKIAFSGLTTTGYNGWDIFTANADGSGQTNLTSDLEYSSSPTWSPDGSRIAFIKDGDLWVMNADGSGATKIFGAADHWEGAPSWSPDGSKIAFRSNLAGQTEFGWMTGDIFTVNNDGTNLAMLTTHPSNDDQPAWSPDGTKIAFSSLRTRGYEIWVMSADGSNQVQLTRNGGTDPSWSPDGETIAFIRGDSFGSNLEIYLIGVDGGHEANLTHSPGPELSPHWQPLPPSSAARTAAVGPAYAPTVQCQNPPARSPLAVFSTPDTQSKRSVCRNRADYCLHGGLGGCILRLPRIEGAPLVYREHDRRPAS